MILYKFASRNRPDKFLNCIENIHKYSKEQFKIVATLDTDDNRISEYLININKYNEIIYVLDKSFNKIHAINRNLNIYPDWDILINMSDDMLFIQEGFDTIICQDMKNNFPDTDGVLHYPDGNRDDLITMSIIGKKYFDRFGYIYHPSYKSLWCDNEFTEVSKILNKYKYSGRQLFKHNHPAYDMKYWDEQYAKTESYNEIDKNNYYIRKNNNFNILL